MQHQNAMDEMDWNGHLWTEMDLVDKGVIILLSTTSTKSISVHKRPFQSIEVHFVHVHFMLGIA